MSPPPVSTLDGALRGRPSAGPLLTRPSAAAGGPPLVRQLLLALVCAAYAVGAALGWGSQYVAKIMGDFGLSAAAAAAAVSCFLYARGRRVRFRPAWLLFALSSAMASLGNLVWGWYEVVLRVPVPSPSYADLFFLCFAPPAIVGLLVLAKRPVTKAGWICLGLDAWLIGGSLLTLAWSLALAQAAKAEGGSSVAHSALSVAYPLLDIALVSMVLALHFRRSPVCRSVLKLDRGLVEGVVESARLHKITSGLLRIATDLGLKSVADGVDLPEQIVALRAMGCTHGQGMAFSGALDEYRLRRALGTGHYPVPHGPAEPAFAGGGGVYTKGVGGPAPGQVVGGVPSGLPAVLSGGTALRSHNETPVPPT
ncbi:hypothetical protein STENM327S_02013 [Streptomyces tendae]